MISHRVANAFPFKAGQAELAIKNLRLRLRRHFTHTGKKQFLSIMPSLVQAYNEAPKRSLGGLSPADAVLLPNEHLRRLRSAQIGERKSSEPKFKKNQIVRIINQKKQKQFSDKMQQNWTSEHFRIMKVIRNRAVPMYVLKHTKNTIDTFGCWYESELTKV
jgi:hypothetical protein